MACRACCRLGPAVLIRHLTPRLVAVGVGRGQPGDNRHAERMIMAGPPRGAHASCARRPWKADEAMLAYALSHPQAMRFAFRPEASAVPDRVGFAGPQDRRGCAADAACEAPSPLNQQVRPNSALSKRQAFAAHRSKRQAFAAHRRRYLARTATLQDARLSRGCFPDHVIGGEVARVIDVPVGGEHRHCAAHDPQGDLVSPCQAGRAELIARAVLAGFDLVSDDPGELDVLGGVVGVDVVEHRQVRDCLHGLALPGEDSEHGLAGVLLGPPPASGQGIDDQQAAPILRALGQIAHDRRMGAGISNDHCDRPGVL